jgi:hypothetical protein
MGPTLTPVQWVPGVKWQGSEVIDHLLPSSGMIGEAIPTLLIRPHGMVLN